MLAAAHQTDPAGADGDGVAVHFRGKHSTLLDRPAQTALS